MFTIRPLRRDDERRERLDHHHGSIDVHLHAQIEFLHPHFRERAERRNTGIVHEAVKAAAGFGHCFHSSCNVCRLRDVQAQGLHVLDRAERLQILFFPRGGIHEVAL